MSVKHLKIYAILLLVLGSSVAIAKDKILDIQRWQTSNGVRVFFVSSMQNPIVDVKMVFNAGAAYDGKMAGIAAITNNMLDEGTKQLSADDIAESFENVGAKFRADIDRDFAQLGFRSLSDKKYLMPTVTVFNEILTQPSFPKGQLNRLRQQTLAALRLEQQKPATVASKAFYKALYGDNPYANNVLGEMETVANIKQPDLEKFYRQYYVAQNAVLVIVGHLSQSEAKQLSENIVVNLPKGEQAMTTNNAVAMRPSLKNISFPSAQTHVLMGQLGINKKSPDYFPVLVGNFVLGGSGLTSRLFDEVREKKGLVYHVSSQFKSMSQAGPFYIILQTRNKEVKNAIDTTKLTLNKYLQSGPTEKELTTAKDNIVLSFPMKLASNAAILNTVADIAAYDLPLDYLDTYRDKVKAVTAEQIKTTFNKLINTNKLVTVLVGQTTS